MKTWLPAQSGFFFAASSLAPDFFGWKHLAQMNQRIQSEPPRKRDPVIIRIAAKYWIPACAGVPTVLMTGFVSIPSHPTTLLAP
jgi:hypothetical protein